MPQPDEYIRLDPYLYLGHESKCNVPLRSTRIILRAALSWVGDFDDMQRLIKIGRGLLPFSGVEGEDRIDCHIRAIAPAWAFRGSRPVLAIMSASPAYSTCTPASKSVRSRRRRTALITADERSPLGVPDKHILSATHVLTRRISSGPTYRHPCPDQLPLEPEPSQAPQAILQSPLSSRTSRSSVAKRWYSSGSRRFSAARSVIICSTRFAA